MIALLVLMLSAQEKANLLSAVQSVNMKQVQQLLDEGADPNIFNRAGETPLMLAAKTGNETLIKLLLENDARPEHLSGLGDTALHYSVRMGRLGVSKVLAESESPLGTRNRQGEWPFQIALRKGDLPMAQMLQKVKSTGNQDELLFQAVLMGKPSMVKLMLEAGSDPDPKGNKRRNPKDMARFALHGRISQIINSHKNADETTDDLFSAFLSSDPQKASEKLPKDLQWRDKGGNTVLMLAAAYGNTELVKLLIDQGADVNQTGSDDRTALHEAIYHGRLGTALTLMAKGADPNKTTLSGRATPLSIAFENKDIYALNYIVAYNGLLITKDPGGAEIKLPFKRARVDLIEQAVSQHKPFFSSPPLTLPGLPPEPKNVYQLEYPGLEPPVITKQTEANFNRKEMPQGPASGNVILSGLIGSDGRVSEISVVKPAHGGRLDFEYFAIRSLRNWQFKPARLDGKAVAVRQDFDILVFRN